MRHVVDLELNGSHLHYQSAKPHHTMPEGRAPQCDKSLARQVVRLERTSTASNGALDRSIDTGALHLHDANHNKQE